MAGESIVTGGCLCGAIRYEARGPRRLNVICHCRMCQRASGAPFLALFFVARENIRVTQGETKTYQSSPEAERHFCGKCGSPLFFERQNRPDIKAIFVGSLDNPNDFTADMQVCLSSAVDWLATRDAVPAHTEKPDGMTPTLNYDPVSGAVMARQ